MVVAVLDHKTFSTIGDISSAGQSSLIQRPEPSADKKYDCVLGTEGLNSPYLGNLIGEVVDSLAILRQIQGIRPIAAWNQAFQQNPLSTCSTG